MNVSNKNNKDDLQVKRGGFTPMGGRRPGMMKGNEKAKDFKGTMVLLLKYLKPFRLRLSIVILFAIIGTVFAIFIPKIMGTMTDQLINDVVKQMTYDQIKSKLPEQMAIPSGVTGADLIKVVPTEIAQKIPAEKLEQIKELDLSKRPEINWQKLAEIAMVLVVLFVVSTVFNYIQSWIMAGVTQQITFNLRTEISEKINKLPLKFFDSRSFGDLISIVTNDVDTISQNLNHSLTQVITSVITIIGVFIMMLSINWQLTLVAIIALPVSLLIISFIVKNTQKFYKILQNELGELNGHIEEMYSGHTVVKAFGGEEKSLSKFNGINTKMYNNALKSQFFTSLIWPIMNFIGNLDFVGVAIVGGYLAVKKTVTVGDIQAFIQYVRQFNQPIIQTANIANVLQSIAAAAERVFAFLAEKEETPDSDKVIKTVGTKGEVEFSNVTFGYDPDVKVIKNFTVKIKPGQRVALVGPTGAGKTTVVNLLMRFYDVDNGSIKIDGTDIRDYARKDLRKMFGMVLQDTWLFNGSIRDNLRYGKLNATNKEVEQVGELAHVDHFIHSLPNGYDMEINEEADNISQGEKQLLTIARAMIANPPMLILDEATSNVDTRTEVLIQKAMEKLMQDRTSFVIAHRLSTIKDADLIIVMKAGSIVEYGTHEELMKKKGHYAELYESQFESD